MAGTAVGSRRTGLRAAGVVPLSRPSGHCAPGHGRCRSGGRRARRTRRPPRYRPRGPSGHPRSVDHVSRRAVKIRRHRARFRRMTYAVRQLNQGMTGVPLAGARVALSAPSPRRLRRLRAFRCDRSRSEHGESGFPQNHVLCCRTKAVGFGVGLWMRHVWDLSRSRGRLPHRRDRQGALTVRGTIPCRSTTGSTRRTSRT